MFGINKLKKRVNHLKDDISSLRRKIWFLENPIIYEKNEKLLYYDEYIHDKEIEVICKGISEHHEFDLDGRMCCDRKYFVMDKKGDIISVSSKFLSKKDEK